METRFFFDVAASPLHDEASVAGILSGYEPALEAAGGARSASAEAPVEAPLFLFVLTGGTEQLVLDRLAVRRERVGREPVILVAHPGHNSLPASLEILARVRRDGGAGRVVFLGGPSEKDEARLAEAARLAQVPKALRRARIGAVGGASDWLVASAQDPATVRESWGPEMVPLRIEDVSSRIAVESGDEAAAGEFADAARGCHEPSAAELAQAMAVYRALRATVAAERLDALTIRCFELVTRDRTTSCLALSRLGDEGVPAGCEGDVPSIVGMLWLHLLTGQMAWMANPARIDLEAGELLLAHCTVPRSLVAGYELRSHFESGLGAAISGELASGPVTLVRLGGAKLESLWLGEGEIVASGREEGLCRTQARIRVSGAALAELLERPLGNHLLVVRGHLGELLRTSHGFVLETGRQAS